MVWSSKNRRNDSGTFSNNGGDHCGGGVGDEERTTTIGVFIKETQDDIASPVTSNFARKIPLFRDTVQGLADNGDCDSESIGALRKCAKDLHQSLLDYNQHEQTFYYAIDRLANVNASDALTHGADPVVGSGLLKLGVLLKNLASLSKGQTHSVHNHLVFPLDALMKLDGNAAKEYKRSVDKAVKEYETKYDKCAKELKQRAKEAGWPRTVGYSEVAEETAKERTAIQREMCNFFLTMNKLSDKKGVELLQHLVDYIATQQSYFEDGLRVLQEYKRSVDELSEALSDVRRRQEGERQALHALHDALVGTQPNHQLPASAAATNEITQNVVDGSWSRGSLRSTCSSSGTTTTFVRSQPPSTTRVDPEALPSYLWKKSSRKKLHHQWQKRRCWIDSGHLVLNHSDETREPVRLKLVVCKIKQSDAGDSSAFDLFCANRTYHFKADDEKTAKRWVIALNMGKEDFKQSLLDSSSDGGGGGRDSLPRTPKEAVADGDVAQRCTESICMRPGNQRCADCDSDRDVTWLSTNIGAVLCIDCSGVHRELGVHVSRIQSLTLDNLTPAELLIPLELGNNAVNSVYEETLKPTAKLTRSASRSERKAFIRAKYVDRRYVSGSSKSSEILKAAVSERSAVKLLKAIVLGVDVNSWLDKRSGDSILMTLVKDDVECSTLSLIEMLLQNGANVNWKNKTEETVLHRCVRLGRVDHLKLLLRSRRRTRLSLCGADGLTPLQLAIQLGPPNSDCIRLLTQSETSQVGEESRAYLEDIHVASQLLIWSSGKRTSVSSGAVSSRVSLASRLPSSNTSSATVVAEASADASTATALLPPPPGRVTTSNGADDCKDGGKPKSYVRSTSDASHIKIGASLSAADEDPDEVMMRTLPGARKVLPKGPPPPVPPNRPLSVNHLLSDKGATPPPLVGRSRAATAEAPVHPDGTAKSASPAAVPRRQTVKEERQPPIPLPRKPKAPSATEQSQVMRRCRTLYDCDADHGDELSFKQAQVIVITKERIEGEDDSWMEGYLEDEPEKKGFFPITFVTFLK